MTLKKNDPRTKEIASMGAKAKNKLYPHTKGEFKKGSKRVRECAPKGIAAAIRNNSSHQSDMGKRSRVHENKVAATLRGDHIFKPNEVCDRIVVRNGEVFFVEIKKAGKKLRPKQELFKSIVQEKYQVIYS